MNNIFFQKIYFYKKYKMMYEAYFNEFLTEVEMRMKKRKGMKKIL